MSSFALWLPDLRARKPTLYEPGCSCRFTGRRGHPFIYGSAEMKLDRADVASAWSFSGWEQLQGPVSWVVYTYRDPSDDTGDWDHWSVPLADHLTRAGAWPDDALIWKAEEIRTEARTKDEAGILVIAWTETDDDFSLS